MGVATPQPGIFAQGTRSHYHLEFDLRPGADPAGVADAVSRLREPHVTAGGANLVVGFGADLWRALAPDEAPAGLGPFPGVEGDGRRAPATQHDAWVWMHGTGPDLLLDMARLVTVAFEPELELAAEQPCFVYLDSRDLTGFIDGTENPPVEEAAEVAVVPEGPGAGGSHVLAQRWVHDLTSLPAAPGGGARRPRSGARSRTASSSSDKPPTAHISRVVIEEAGEELEIYRRSAPYGTVREHGLYFVAFSADRTRFDKMLARMFGTTGDGLHDHLTDFSRPVSGAYYFAPSLQALAALT